MASSKTVVLVTGANRGTSPMLLRTQQANGTGIGYNIVRSLATRLADGSRTDGKPLTCLLAGRQADKAEAAAAELQKILAAEGVQSPDIQAIGLDVVDDAGIRSAVANVRKRFGRLDGSTLEEARGAYRDIIDTNVTSVANLTKAFAPLLQANGRGLVIKRLVVPWQHRTAVGSASPPTMNLPYSMSKVALNGLTLELSKQYRDIEFQLICPGHCGTEFNNFRGKRDPLEGATVVTLLVERWLRGEDHAVGFWETKGAEWQLSPLHAQLNHDDVHAAMTRLRADHFRLASALARPIGDQYHAFAVPEAPQACLACKKRKKRCNRQLPICSSCTWSVLCGLGDFINGAPG
ncbi:hypothetical protein MRB53_041910 [Persea americana]|nr:hypothetical protein MRB53_041910 [Persea americana]